MEKLISVIIPMYNAEKTILNTLDSILNQSYKNLEILVVNDGSDDSSSTLVQSLRKKDKRIILIDDDNHGVSHARNVGLRNAKGEYVQFVDADDTLDLDYFKIMQNLLATNDCDIAICNNIHPYFYTHLDDHIYDLTNHDEFLNYYQHTFAPTLPWNKLYKKEVVDGIFFEENIKFAEDEVFACATLGRIKKVVSTKDVLYHYSFDYSEEGKSAIQKFLKGSKFWLNHTSLYYMELECLPAKIDYFAEHIKNKRIPIENINEVLYQRVCDYAIYEYAAYVGSGVAEDALLQELTNIFRNTYFHKAINVQTKYGLKFKSFFDKDLEHYIYKLNHSVFNMYSTYFKDEPLNVNPNMCAAMLFAKFFIIENNSINNANILNRLDNELNEGQSPNALFVNNILKNLNY